MNYLLDTHAFLWWIAGHNNLSARARQVISNQDNIIYFSAASAWEIAIKAKLGKIEIEGPIDSFLLEQLQENNITSLAVQVKHALHTSNLPPLHRDPFDRLLIAQSLSEGFPIITADKQIREYQVETCW